MSDKITVKIDVEFVEEAEEKIREIIRDEIKIHKKEDIADLFKQINHLVVAHSDKS